MLCGCKQNFTKYDCGRVKPRIGATQIALPKEPLREEKRRPNFEACAAGDQAAAKIENSECNGDARDFLRQRRSKSFLDWLARQPHGGARTRNRVGMRLLHGAGLLIATSCMKAPQGSNRDAQPGEGAAGMLLAECYLPRQRRKQKSNERRRAFADPRSGMTPARWNDWQIVTTKDRK